MELIQLVGTLVDDPEDCVDKHGRNYTRFTVTCWKHWEGGRTEFTHYSCVMYFDESTKNLSPARGLKKGDQVIVHGKLSARLRTDTKGKTYMNLNVLVGSLEPGEKAENKKAQNTNKK